MPVRALAVLGAVTALPPLAIDMYLPALPQLSVDLAAGPAEAQLTLTALMVGLAIGQFAVGPLSDRIGRRVPVLLGITAFAIASFGCALARGVEVLGLLRLAQGLAGGAAVVAVRAMVRDQADTRTAARVFAQLMLVMGTAPIVAPVVGAQLLRFTRWPGLFVLLGALGLVLTLLATWRLGETLPMRNRAPGGVAEALGTLGIVVRDGPFRRYAVVGAASFGAMFAYIGASPFVLQRLYGLSAPAFSAVFAANAAGLITLSQVGGRLVGRVGPRRLLLTGVMTAALGALLLLAVAVTRGPLPLLLLALFAVVASVGLVAPNATALALAGHGARAGSASALLGVLQFAVGAVAAPLTGLGAGTSAVALSVVVAFLTLLALATAVPTARVTAPA